MVRLRTYKLTKYCFGCGQFRFSKHNIIFQRSFTKFRGGLLKLECNLDRFNNIPFNNRLCPLFKANS